MDRIEIILLWPDPACWAGNVKQLGISKNNVKANGQHLEKTSYVGGRVSRCDELPFDRVDQAKLLPNQWQWCAAHEQFDLGVQAIGRHLRVAKNDEQFLVLRGYCVERGNENRPLQATCNSLLRRYIRTRSLPFNLLDGSFSVALLDRPLGRILLYRNLVGCANTFYYFDSGSFLFANNLSDLIASRNVRRRPNESALPLFFVFRYVPGRQTMFDGIHRLMPGEQIIVDQHGMQRDLIQSIRTFQGERRFEHDATDAIDNTMSQVVSDIAQVSPSASVLMSGGVDSSYLQAKWSQAGAAGAAKCFCVTVDHNRCREDANYAITAARTLSTDVNLLPSNQTFIGYILETLQTTAEPPNHVQGAYVVSLAREMTANGVDVGLCGEAADGIFGLGSAYLIQNAELMRRLVPIPIFRRALSALLVHHSRFDGLRDHLRLADHLYDMTYIDHPVNQQAAYTHFPSILSCFGEQVVQQALRHRREMLEEYGTGDNLVQRLHAANLFTSSIDTASFWAEMFRTQGADLICPYLDSRMLRTAWNTDHRYLFPFRKPKELLKQVLARYAPDLAFRKKLGFGQPIFEWMQEGGQLRPWIEEIGRYEFVKPAVLREARTRPNWFLYSLLCYDLWFKMYITGELPSNVTLADESAG